LICSHPPLALWRTQDVETFEFMRMVRAMLSAN
jgi:hypothetical protein